MDIREIDPVDQALVRRHWEIGKSADTVGRPYDFWTPWPLAWLSVSEGREDVETVLLGAFDGETMWGAARVDHSRFDNLHSATAAVYAHPTKQRRGIGRTLVEASYEVARQRGRRLITTEAFAPLDDTSPGLLFAESMGFTTAIEDGMKVVDLIDTEPLWEPLEAGAAARREGYRIVTWMDRVPEEHVRDYCRLNEMFFDEAPMGDLDIEAERWDADRVRKRQERNSRQGRHDVSAGAVAADGTMVGITEVSLSDGVTWRGYQSGTLVDPAHRGHALGLSIKIANHHQLRRHFPECRVLVTGNADVNAPMNAVNDVLGYREVERCLEMQRPL